MVRLTFALTIAFVALPAMASLDRPETKREVCEQATLDTNNPRIQECSDSTSNIENMHACLMNTLMFDTFMECVNLTRFNTITTAKIDACGAATVMRTRFLNCVSFANNIEVTAEEIQSCDKEAQKQDLNGYGRGRYFLKCVDTARTPSANIDYDKNNDGIRDDAKGVNGLR